MSALRKAEQFAIAVIGIAAIARLVMPGRHTAAIINAQADGLRMMVKVATAERAIAVRDVPRFEHLLGVMDDDTMNELFAGLTDADLDWVQTQLGGWE
jgi:hypothetical protein